MISEASSVINVDSVIVMKYPRLALLSPLLATRIAFSASLYRSRIPLNVMSTHTMGSAASHTDVVTVKPLAPGQEHATVAGGCFWCIESVFNHIKGVDTAISGYIGGSVLNPTYKQVCGGETGHAEAVQITFRPAEVSFERLLDVFFSIHDPTTLNYQGADVGTQYRSGIFYHSPEQKAIAEKVIAEKSKEYSAPIVTEVTAASTFYPAEEYHQRYFERNPTQGYCRAVVGPKVSKASKSWKDLWRD